jgi:hypothetical protein
MLHSLQRESLGAKAISMPVHSPVHFHLVVVRSGSSVAMKIKLNRFDSWLTLGLISLLGPFLCLQTLAAPGSTNNVATKTCFQCAGTGQEKCVTPGCRDGRKTCPAPCLKLSVGLWEKRDVAGHTDPNERWQKVKFGNKSAYWSSGHLGEIPTLAADGTFSSPQCPTCRGSTTVACPKCTGTGQIACQFCAGRKTVPETWSKFDHPKMKDRPKKFTLKDGRVLIGRRIAEADGKVSLRTETSIQHLPKDDIAAEEPQPTQL